MIRGREVLCRGWRESPATSRLMNMNKLITVSESRGRTEYCPVSQDSQHLSIHGNPVQAWERLGRPGYKFMQVLDPGNLPTTGKNSEAVRSQRAGTDTVQNNPRIHLRSNRAEPSPRQKPNRKENEQW